jgi:hypothetical protein
MTIDVERDELTWLTRFFSGSNHLSWQDIVDGNKSTKYVNQISPWLKQFSDKSDRTQSLVLPLLGVSGPIAWYAMASEDRQYLQLIDEIKSFIGPAYSDFTGVLSNLECAEEHEIALKERFGNRIFKFVPGQNEDIEEIEKALVLYHSLLSRRPDLPDRTHRPFREIRRDFDYALIAGNANRATELLEELCDTGRINAELRKFLEIRFLSGLGRQDELANNQALITSVMDLSLPPQTIADIVEALYDRHILPIETSDPVSIRDVFNKCIARRFGAVFKERKGIRVPKVLRSFLLYESVQSEYNSSRCESIISAFPDAVEGKRLADLWLSHFITPSDPVEVVDLQGQVRQAIYDEDYLVAVDLCFQELSTPWVYSALLRCAAELESEDLTKRVLGNLTEDRIQLLNDKDNKRLKQLQESLTVESAEPLPSNWVEWAKWVSSEQYKTSPILVLQECVLQWDIDAYLKDPSQCEILAQIIGNSSNKQEEVFKSAFPYIIDFFIEKQSRPDKKFAELYASLIKVIAWGGATSADELEIASLLVQTLLECGLNHSVYCDCLEDLIEIVNANNSIIHLDWALNLAETLIIYPAQDIELRLRLFIAITNVARSVFRRMTGTQRGILTLLARDYGCFDLLDFLATADQEEISEDINTKFSGTIGIYTLTEGAAKRAKEYLGSILPNARIEINGDSVATEKLTALARNADLFVFAWKSSKHQAYYCVKEARKGQNIILPPGKGAASIVRSVLDGLA